MMDLNILNWNWTEKAAAGRHVISYVAGGITVLVGWHLLSPQDATSIADNLNTTWDGLVKVGSGISGLVATGLSIRAALTAKKSAEPASQIKSVVTNLSAPQATQAMNAIADPEGRNKLIAAVSKMDEVRAIVVPESLASAVPSEKVVGSPDAAAHLPLAVPR